MQRDNVVAMQQWLEAHPGAEWTRPGRGLIGDHAVLLPQDDGPPVRHAHHDLGALVDFLHALDRGSQATAGH